MKLGDRKARLLKELEITEVSLVISAANEGAKVMFFKNEQLDFNKLDSYSVQELTDVMKTMDFEKIGVTPAELFEDYVNELRDVHNTELSQRQKNPPGKLTPDEVEELRLKKPWTISQAQSAARRTNIGQGLWAMVENTARENAAKRDEALINRLKKMGEDLEAMKAMAQSTTDIYKRIKRGRKPNMETIEEITQSALDGQFSDKQKAWAAVEKLLRSEVSKSDTGMGFNQALLLAMSKPSWNAFYEAYTGLPEAPRKVEKEEKRPVGKAMAEINKRAEKMLKEGVVDTIEKGVVRVVESHPELEEQHRREMYG